MNAGPQPIIGRASLRRAIHDHWQLRYEARQLARHIVRRARELGMETEISPDDHDLAQIRLEMEDERLDHQAILTADERVAMAALAQDDARQARAEGDRRGCTSGR